MFYAYIEYCVPAYLSFNLQCSRRCDGQRWCYGGRSAGNVSVCDDSISESHIRVVRVFAKAAVRVVSDGGVVRPNRWCLDAEQIIINKNVIIFSVSYILINCNYFLLLDKLVVN